MPASEFLKFAFPVLGAIIVLGLLFYKVWFLRNPGFEVPEGKVLLSPAQGKVKEIRKIGKKESLEIKKNENRLKIWLDGAIEESGYLISIVMTPLDIHFQKAPISGKITLIRHTKGRHRYAMGSIKKTAENEHQEFLIEGDFPVKVVQIAGLLARRCISLAKPGREVKKGGDLGLIRFGSQVSLVIPELPLKIKTGDKVKAGQTIIAEYSKYD